ncbi:hypothetical protein [Anaerocellum diazotrophicum]|uniref:Uncharacterized protein n=1 Tax=Caldicellulosiruptor diazotrophicus TaxID=2806205 RepID=A0ABM7NNV6_9FIRM|nr:hypothetical protein [Caldicellulosiruptor diazotrophicus]BCS81815.1 hypothetical protein CaldiYA01_17750 [Caldicellulosiruptor diazotrophicus]
MSIINSVKNFVDRASYALKQGIKEEVNSWTGGVDNWISHGASGAWGAAKAAVATYKAETTGLRFAAEKTATAIATKVAEKAIVKGIAEFIGGPIARAPDIYHIIHGTVVGWKAYGK